jgi:AraC family transcriptional regulator
MAKNVEFGLSMRLNLYSIVGVTTATPRSHPRQKRSLSASQMPHIAEKAIWRGFERGWRQVYGGFYDTGVSIEVHEFDAESDFDWGRSFHPGSVELCLNIEGHATINSEQGQMRFEGLSAGFYAAGSRGLSAVRRGGEHHKFVTIEFSSTFLNRHLGPCDGGLHATLQETIRAGGRTAVLGEVVRLTAGQEQLANQMALPPVFQAARELWYQGKVLQLMAQFFFAQQGEEELFCDRHKRVGRERVDKVIAILKRSVSEPPDLQAVGREVGCSPFYLSRTFSAQMGCTIPQYLRKLRMERAAELLRSGKHNVTEVALEVGYSSLSHFSQAFCQTIGCCPVLYRGQAAQGGSINP